MAPHNVVVIYKEWANSILCEDGVRIRSISQLNSQNLLMRLYRLLTYSQSEADLNLQDSTSATVYSDVESISSLLRQLRADGIRTNLQPSDLAAGDFQSLLEIIWILILNYSIHYPGESPSHQKTPSIGTKLLLKWCSELLGGACFDYRLSMTENMEKDVLHNIINNVTNLVSSEDEPEPCDYHEAIAEAERKLGVSSNLLRVCDNQTENLAVTVYISLLRRKRELISTGHAPTQPTVLVNHHSQSMSSSSLSRSHLSMHNDKTQQVLMDIERQLGLYQNGVGTSSRLANSHDDLLNTQLAALPASKYQTGGGDSLTASDLSRVPSSTSSGTVNSAAVAMPSPISRAHGSFPNESYNSLKIDLSQLQQQAGKKSCSTSSTPRHHVNGSGHGQNGHGQGSTTDFAELLRQLKDKERRDSGENEPLKIEQQTAERYEEDDEDRTSPKSAPNTDEGFGTFTKTTPRGKDSASEGSDDHTDCEVDHLSAGQEEPGSITDWWDKLEIPADITTIDSVTFQKQLVTEHTVSQVEEGGEFELAEDELMCMIDSIGMNGIKATSGLVSAQETELRLLHILKERDDLVLSYHGALKELSKLTARMKDENHLLRKQLNMTDLSHNEIVLALEEQASDGRQLALSLQEDLTDTEVNVLARLREDKLVLEDRLAALEHQYNCDLAKWRSELAIYKSKASLSPESEGITRENHMLKLQLEEMRSMFDVTVNQTQEECNNYLLTIDRLKEEISNSKSPMSDSQLTALASRQAEMEKLYESMIGSLEGDNSKLLAELEELQLEVKQLKLEQEKHDKCCGTGQSVSESGVGTDSPVSVNRSMNTNLSQSTKGTCTVDVLTAVKSVETDEDAEIVALHQQLSQMQTQVAQGRLDHETLEQQKSGLLENHKRLSDRLSSVESQLQMTQHKLTTLQAVHELVLSKNESLERDLNSANNKLKVESASNDQLRRQLDEQIEKSRSESRQLSSEVSSLQMHLNSSQSEVASFRQREVDLNSELTKLTLERSNLQGKVNKLNSDLVNQKAQYMSQVLRAQQLEAAKSGLESQTEEFKLDSLELFKQLDEARQQKDDLNQQLSSLHSQLSDSMKSWQHKLRQQEEGFNQVKYQLEDNLRSEQANSQMYKSEMDKSNSELSQLRQKLQAVTELSESRKQQLDDVVRTAKLDRNADDVIEQLNNQLKSLQQQNAEYRFTTTHFRSENSQLQLRVNQLEELNKTTEQRNAILQKELSTVQASLDDSYSSADAQLNLLDLSSSDLMSINDASELRNYIMAAKRQVEMMQNKRAKTNIEYSQKIAEMEKLVKGRGTSSSDVPSSSESDCKVPQSVSGSEYMSSVTDFVKLPPKIDMNSSYTSANLTVDLVQQAGGHLASRKPGVAPPAQDTPTSAKLASSQLSIADVSPISHVTSDDGLTSDSRSSYEHNMQSKPLFSTSASVKPKFTSPSYLANNTHTPRTHGGNSQLESRLFRSSGGHTMYEDLSDIELPGLPELPDSLSLKVQSLTNRPGTSTPTYDMPSDSSRHHGTVHQPSNQTGHGVKMSAIECENAALRAELELINSDRTTLQKQMESHIGQHDVLNETLDELERSLEEVYDSNKLLRDTLGDCNDFIQTNILSGNASTPSAHSRFRSEEKLPQTSTRSRSLMNMSRSRPHSVSTGVRSHSVAPAVRPPNTAHSVRPHSVTPSMRPESVTPGIRPHSVTPGIRPHSVTPGIRPHSGALSNRATPFSVTFGGSKVTTYFEGDEKIGWSAQTDRHLTSSSDFNKLQQTNVHNYESLLLSDTNTKSPTRRAVSASKSTDLNHMIQHSLSKLSQINSTPSGSQSSTLPPGSSSTPLKSSVASSRYADSTESEDERYVTARQYNTPHTLRTTTSYGREGEDKSNTYRQPAVLIEKLSGTYEPKTENSLRFVRPGSSSLRSLRNNSDSLRYNDGGPGPEEPKAVLPEPVRARAD